MNENSNSNTLKYSSGQFINLAIWILIFKIINKVHFFHHQLFELIKLKEIYILTD